MSRYIHQQADWPKFHWNQEAIAAPLAAVRHRQGRLLGRMEGLGFTQRDEAVLRTLTLDVVKSGEIEGESLDAGQVRSSIARRLGLDIAGLIPADRRVEGVVEMTLEATQEYAKSLSVERLFAWHAALFPAETGSASILKPPVERLDAELASFLAWANRTGDIDPVLRAAQAHLWFVTLHPFDDGNGRIARAIADWALARSEESPRRFYSMSAQIRRERAEYYGILESTQKGALDITEWMEWFLACLDRAIAGAESSLAAVFQKDRFWKTHAQASLNERQRLILNKLLDGGFEGKLTSSKWAKLAKCSQDTAQRDIAALLELGVLSKAAPGGRSTSYSLKNPA